MRRFTSLLAAGGAAVLVTAALSGCATPTAGSPTPTDRPADAEVSAAWLDDGRSIGLVTLGSSTCVPWAESATLEGDVLVVGLADSDPDAACTADFAPRATVLSVPDGVDPGDDLRIRVGGDGISGETTLGGVAGLAGPGGETDYLPSAGWTSTAGQFVLLTWGSSTCVPVISGVAATAAAEVTVTFETPPADQVCTMDMAPRGTVVQVDGLEKPDGAEAVLTGSPEFDDIRIPLLGTN